MAPAKSARASAACSNNSAKQFPAARKFIDFRKLYEDTKDMDYAQFADYIRQRIANSEFASFLDRPASGTPSAARQGQI